MVDPSPMTGMSFQEGHVNTGKHTGEDAGVTHPQAKEH